MSRAVRYHLESPCPYGGQTPVSRVPPCLVSHFTYNLASLRLTDFVVPSKDSGSQKWLWWDLCDSFFGVSPPVLAKKKKWDSNHTNKCRYSNYRLKYSYHYHALKLQCVGCSRMEEYSDEFVRTFTYNFGFTGTRLPTLGLLGLVACQWSQNCKCSDF